MNQSLGNAIRRATMSMVADRADYYGEWMYDAPFLIERAEDQDLRRLQSVMHKLITHFVTNYDRWSHLMPVSADAQRVLRAFRDKPYRCGTYRVDTVFDQRQQKIIEITCRFPLNGIFLAAIAYHFGQQCLRNTGAEQLKTPPLLGIFEHLARLIGQHRKVIFLRNQDGRNASKYFLPIFEAAGLSTQSIMANKVARHTLAATDGFLVNELSIKEVEQLPDQTLRQIAAMDMVNDLRTTILIHDKRFFDVIGDPDFRQSILSPAEIELLDQFYLPTHGYGTKAEAWQAARANQNNWILKHRSLGKSEEIYPGPHTSPAEWQGLFERPDVEQFILQRYVHQPQFSGSVQGTPYNDFVTGTLMFFDEHYFGPGIMRASSFPVTNKVDDRKMFCLIATSVQQPTH